MPPSEMLRRVALVRRDVSEELIASIIRVTRICEVGTTLAVTSNRSTLRFKYVCACVTNDYSGNNVNPPPPNFWAVANCPLLCFLLILAGSTETFTADPQIFAPHPGPSVYNRSEIPIQWSRDVELVEHTPHTAHRCSFPPLTQTFNGTVIANGLSIFADRST
jgi:hypothetical protein